MKLRWHYFVWTDPVNPSQGTSDKVVNTIGLQGKVIRLVKLQSMPKQWENHATTWQILLILMLRYMGSKQPISQHDSSCEADDKFYLSNVQLRNVP